MDYMICLQYSKMESPYVHADIEKPESLLF